MDEELKVALKVTGLCTIPIWLLVIFILCGGMKYL